MGVLTGGYEKELPYFAGAGLLTRPKLMLTIVDKAIQVSSPLALAGLFAAILSGAIRLIIKKNSGKETLKTILVGLFVLSLVAMLLGFWGWIIRSGQIRAVVYEDKQPIGGLTVSFNNLNGSVTTNSEGLFVFDLSGSDLPDTLGVQFSSSQFQKQVDTLLPRKNFPERIYLTNSDFRFKANDKRSLVVNVREDESPKEGITVRLPDYQMQGLTNRDGKAGFEVPFEPGVDSTEVLLQDAKSQVIKDTLAHFINFPLTFRLSKVTEPVPPSAPKTFSTTSNDPDVIEKLRTTTGAEYKQGSDNVIEISFDPGSLTHSTRSGTYQLAAGPAKIFVKQRFCCDIPGAGIDAEGPSLDQERLAGSARLKARDLFLRASPQSLNALRRCLN
jgi:hypothetical protein